MVVVRRERRLFDLIVVRKALWRARLCVLGRCW